MLFTKTVECGECKHIIRKEVAQVVKSDMGDLLYCPEHKKDYSRVYSGLLWRGYYMRRFGRKQGLRFFREVEVDSNGTPVGYVKAPSVQEVVNEIVKKGPGRPQGSKNKKTK